jgi:hypothetical protein
MQMYVPVGAVGLASMTVDLRMERLIETAGAQL